ncbi:hypothetical protein AMK26_22515 [Streptomyces sp. CB03234]|uniref:hypothetical protein n=1 Tax=Streptomyces sp. (strain CB03234) TaxID=1703937 RepID=UPI00093B41B7|nr:hypothetical protein [Streptomyces sp. CB03234]OKK02429.1 hypothetical protein AMK26_22515 [Streptomyces sp. CB03234]
MGIPPGVGPRPPGRQSDRSRPADTPGRRGLTARADGAYRRDESVSPVVFLLLLFLPAAALVALASRRL